MERQDQAKDENGQNHITSNLNENRNNYKNVGPGTSNSYLSVSHMVRQQSDTTHNNRRLVRSQAVCDDRPATSCDQVS
uniref:Protein kinase domain-containing protein n=1 Tax=Panagrolaimus sp. JU765 TaxID=591449 RepID=A0AC34REN7_9BILA